MARKALTDRTIRALKPAGPGARYDVLDALVPGLGVRVTEKGQRTFILIARFPGSRNPTRRALGDYGALSLEAARSRAREWLRMIAEGVDPKARAEDERRAELRRQSNTVSAVA